MRMAASLLARSLQRSDAYSIPDQSTIFGFSLHSGWRQRPVSLLWNSRSLLALLREGASETQAGDSNENKVTRPS
jgi:hypothetical protein